MAGSIYRAEFFRPNDTTPFRTRDIVLCCQNDRCHGQFTLPPDHNQAEMTKLQAKMADPKLPLDERMKVVQQFAQLQQAMNKNFMGRPGENPKEANDSCSGTFFDVRTQAVSGSMCCGNNVGHPDPRHICGSLVNFTGTAKFLGP
jgi:hypothetical protein